MQLLGLLRLLFFFVVSGLYQNVEHTLEHGKGIIPDQRQYLSLLSTLLGEGVDYFA